MYLYFDTALDVYISEQLKNISVILYFQLWQQSVTILDKN